MGIQCVGGAGSAFKSSDMCAPELNPCQPNLTALAGFTSTGSMSALKMGGPEGVTRSLNQGGSTGGPYRNGDGQNAPNYDYYLNPDQGQLNYRSLWPAQDFINNFGVSEREAQALVNSARHKPNDKQQQFLATFTDLMNSGIFNPTFNDVKQGLVSRGYNPNDQYQNTEITAWTNWFAQGDLYNNLL